MIKLSQVNKYTEIPCVIDEIEEQVEHEIEKNFSSSIHFDDVIVTRHPRKIKIWDIKNLPKINLISSFDIDWEGSFIKKEGDLIYLGQKKAIKIVDVSNLKKPILVRTVTFPKDQGNYVNFYVLEGIIYVMIDKAIYTVDQTNTISKVIDLSNEYEMMFNYPMDIKVNKNKLYMAFRHCGLYVYERSELDQSYEFQSNHKPVNGYTPTYMQWLNPEESILLIGNDNVVKYDLTNSKKLKRFKAAKIAKSEVFGGEIKRENELFIAANKISKGKFVTGVIGLDDKGIQLVNTPKLEYKIREKFGEDIKGIILKDNYLLIIGKETGFYLFEANK